MFVDNLSLYTENIALIGSDGTRLTYGELEREAEQIGKRTERRRLVFLLCRNTTEAVIGYVGFLRNRVVPVMLDAAIDHELLHNLLELYHPSYIYAPGERKTEFEGADLLWEGKEYRLFQYRWKKTYAVHKDLALLLTTSGSTGSPKFVRQTYRNIQSNAEAIVEYLKIGPDERPITTLPMNYTYGLSILHSHLQAGAALLVTDASLIRKEFWDFAKKEKATSFGGVPYTYEMLKKIHFTKMDLPYLRYMTQAGGKLSPELHREYAEYAQKNGKRFVVMYGQTEATARMAYLPAECSLNKIGSMGIPIPGGTLKLLDVNNDEILDTGVVGELIYEGDNVTMGYAECGDDLIKEDEFRGVLMTGDMAKRDQDGFYYIVGRKKRFLKLYGSRVNLDEMDLLIKREFPELECASTGNDDLMVTYITDSDKISVVSSYILETTHINQRAVSVRFIHEIPKNNAGKVLYKELKGE